MIVTISQSKGFLAALVSMKYSKYQLKNDLFSPIKYAFSYTRTQVALLYICVCHYKLVDLKSVGIKLVLIIKLVAVIVTDTTPTSSNTFVYKCWIRFSNLSAIRRLRRNITSNNRLATGLECVISKTNCVVNVLVIKSKQELLRATLLYVLVP